MLPTSIRASPFRSFLRPNVRARRLFTSSFFLATFCGAILTVSVSTLLPCPARVGPGQYKSRGERIADQASSSEAYEEEGGGGQRRTPSLVHGERIRLTKKGGWIEIGAS